MNQKDYKEIAGIINYDFKMIQEAKEYYRVEHMIKRLADYFEKEDYDKTRIRIGFNRQQFLKDCGMK